MSTSKFPQRRVTLRQNARTGRVARYGYGDCSPEWVFPDVASASAWIAKVGATCEHRVMHAGPDDEISGNYEYTWAIPQEGK